MEYPKSFDSCPNCESTSRFVQYEVDIEIGKGHLAKNARVPILVGKAPIFNPNDNSILLVKRKFPVLVAFFDICTECGTLYCVEIMKQEAEIEPQINKPKPGHNPKGPLFFGKG